MFFKSSELFYNHFTNSKIECSVAIFCNDVIMMSSRVAISQYHLHVWQTNYFHDIKQNYQVKAAVY